MAYSALEATSVSRWLSTGTKLKTKKKEHTLNNGIHGAALLAVTAVDTLGHIDVVTGRPSASINTFLGFDGDGLGRADGLAEFAGDAALLAGGIAAQGVFATEAGGDGTLFKGVEDGVSAVRLISLSFRTFIYARLMKEGDVVGGA